MTLLDRRWHAPPNWAHTQQTYFVFVIIVQERVPGDDTSREKAKIQLMIKTNMLQQIIQVIQMQKTVSTYLISLFQCTQFAKTYCCCIKLHLLWTRNTLVIKFCLQYTTTWVNAEYMEPTLSRRACAALTTAGYNVNNLVACDHPLRSICACIVCDATRPA